MSFLCFQEGIQGKKAIRPLISPPSFWTYWPVLPNRKTKNGKSL